MTELTLRRADGVRPGKRRIGDWLRAQLRAVARERRARCAASDHAKRDDHLLRDIGLARDQIDRARLARWKPIRCWRLTLRSKTPARSTSRGSPSIRAIAATGSAARPAQLSKGHRGPSSCNPPYGLAPDAAARR